MGRALAALSLVLALAGAAPAREIPPPPARYVLDEPGWLDAGRKRLLEDRLLRFERETSNQLVVALFDSLGGEDLADWSHRVAETWRIGQEDKDNGILLAVFAAERRIDIEVGYGLEGAVPDAVAARIIREVLTPRLRQGDPAGAILAGADALMAAARGEFEGTGRARGENERRDPGIPVGLIFFALMFLLAGRRSRRAFGPLVFFGGGIGRGGRGGGFGGGGGFLGGGGSFGGGGARGGW
jgi:uncharacterized protein